MYIDRKQVIGSVGWRKQSVTSHVYKVSFQGDEKVLKSDYGDGGTTLKIRNSEYTKSYSLAKMGNIMVCELLFNKSNKRKQNTLKMLSK